MSASHDRIRLFLGVALAPLVPGTLLAAMTGEINYVLMSVFWYWIPAALIIWSTYWLLKHFFVLNLITLVGAGVFSASLLTVVILLILVFGNIPFRVGMLGSSVFLVPVALITLAISAVSGAVSAAAFWLIALFDWKRLGKRGAR